MLNGQITRWIAALSVAAGLLVGTAPVNAQTPNGGQSARFAATVQSIEALPYQAAYTPVGFDAAFPGQNVANTAPAEDYTSGSIPGDPDAPAWPVSFHAVTLHSADGAPLLGMLALHSGSHPAVLVVHGFNTHGMLSVIRWAAMLYANGYDVLAADQRDFSFEYSAGLGYPTWLQTFGWKESQDVLAAGRYLRAQPGVLSEGVVGFSEGAQNTVLALAQDSTHVFSAGITFSGPADQNNQVYSTAVPANCQTPLCTYPTTDALVAAVVPPYSYTDPCAVLSAAATRYATTPYAILGQESGMHAQTAVSVPLLNFYAADDSLVAPINATLMAAFESGHPLQRTVEIQHGEHAYYFDRWWQQQAILTYFHNLLGMKNQGTQQPTVNRTPGGATLSTQLVPIPALTHSQADALLAPFICDTTKPAPAQ